MMASAKARWLAVVAMMALTAPAAASSGPLPRLRGRVRERASLASRDARRPLSLTLPPQTGGGGRKESKESDVFAPDLVGAWSGEERRAIARASSKIPGEIRARAPATVVRDATACRDGSGWPDDDRDLVDDRGWIHLCPLAPTTTPATPDAIARLAVEAQLFAFDRAARWS